MWRSLATALRGRPPVPGTGPVEVAPPPDAVAALPSPEVAPDVVGLPVSDARRVGRMLGQRVYVVDRAAGPNLWGRVLEQEPAAGSPFEPDGLLVLTVGAKPDVTVPDVRGRTEHDALALLQQAGLGTSRGSTRRSDRVPEGHVVRTRPRAGAEVPVGSLVSYVVAAEPRRVNEARGHDRHRVRAARRPDGSFRREDD